MTYWSVLKPLKCFPKQRERETFMLPSSYVFTHSTTLKTAVICSTGLWSSVGFWISETEVLQPLSGKIKVVSFLGVFPFNVFYKCLIDLIVEKGIHTTHQHLSSGKPHVKTESTDKIHSLISQSCALQSTLFFSSWIKRKARDHVTMTFHTKLSFKRKTDP